MFATIVMMVLWAGPVGAHHHPDHTCSGDAGVIGGGGSADGSCETENDGDPPGGESGEAECDDTSGEIAYYAQPPEELSDHYTDLALQIEIPEGMAYLAAYNCAGVYQGGPHLVPDPGIPDSQDVRDRARARVVPPLPTPRVSPGETVVQLPTWLWVDPSEWQPRAAVETDGAVSVRVEARPVRTTWNLVEGERSCDGPGVAWSEDAQAVYETQPEHARGTGNPACTFTFVNSSTTRPDGVYHSAVTVTWEFAWWLNGAAQGTFGSVQRTSAFDLRVGEIQSLITN